MGRGYGPVGILRVTTWNLRPDISGERLVGVETTRLNADLPTDR